MSDELRKEIRNINILEKVMSVTIVCIILAIICFTTASGCKKTNRLGNKSIGDIFIKDVEYLMDHRTGLCFAVVPTDIRPYPLTYSVMNVPCDAVRAQLKVPQSEAQQSTP